MATLSVGAAVRDITPSYPAMAYGYGARDHKSDGVAEPLSLSVLALADGNSTVLLVAFDLLGIPVHVCQRLYAHLEKATGISFPHLLISCTHTHFAPGLHTSMFPNPDVGRADPDPRFVKDVETKLAEAAMEALRNLTPASLETVRVPVPAVVFNRRTITEDGTVVTNYLYPRDAQTYRFSPVDPEMTVLRVRDEREIRAAWVNFGCHPVTGTDRVEDGMYRFSADYPYYLRQTLAKAWHCPVMVTLGAAGDAVPANRGGNCRNLIGTTLANSAILAERRIVGDSNTTLDAWMRTVQAETIVHVDAEQAQQQAETCRKRVMELRESKDTSASDALNNATKAYAEAAMRAHRARLYPDNRFDIPIQFLRIGTTTLVALPFEVLSEISLRMKNACPNAVLVSCAGGYQGYLPLEYEYDRGGYEATSSSTHFVPGTADKLLKTILDELAQTTQ